HAPVRLRQPPPPPAVPYPTLFRSAVNGVPFYNPYNAEGQDAAMNDVFDECCGHPDPMGRYHYHIYPKCIHTSFVDKPGEHSPLIDRKSTRLNSSHDQIWYAGLCLK